MHEMDWSRNSILRRRCLRDRRLAQLDVGTFGFGVGDEKAEGLATSSLYQKRRVEVRVCIRLLLSALGSVSDHSEPGSLGTAG